MPTKVFSSDLNRTDNVYVGIDQSLTGFALSAVSSKDVTKSITWVYKSTYFGIERLADIREWLTDTLDYLEEEGAVIIDVAIEGSVLQSHAALKLGELAAVVKMALRDYFEEGDKSRYPLQVPPMTLKKYASGKGNSKKQEMLLQMYKRWGVEFNDDNAADAYALARLVSGIGINEVEKAVITQMGDAKYRDEKRLG